MQRKESGIQDEDTHFRKRSHCFCCWGPYPVAHCGYLPSKHDWIDKTVIPFQAHEGWTGYALKDWKAAYKGAKICCEGAIRSNSAGGNQLITGEMDVQKCLRQATKEVSCQ